MLIVFRSVTAYNKSDDKKIRDRSSGNTLRKDKVIDMQELIAAKKQFARIGWLYLAASVLISLVSLILGRVLWIAVPELLMDMNINMIFGMVPMYIVSFPLLALMMKKFVPGERIERHKMTAGQYVLSAIICIGIAYAANIIGMIMTGIIGAVTGNPVENEINTVVTALSPWAVIFLTVLCAPVIEELVFRKLLIDRTVRYGQGVAVVLSGLMFGLFHGNLNQFVYAAAIGTFLAYLYVRTGNIKITISLHMLFNFIGGFLPSMLQRQLSPERLMGLMESESEYEMIRSLGADVIWLVLYGVLALFVLGMLAAGVILFIVFAAMRKFKFDPGQTAVPRELKLSLALGNVGMAAFCLYWAVQIISQLLG